MTLVGILRFIVNFLDKTIEQKRLLDDKLIDLVSVTKLVQAEDDFVKRVVVQGEVL